MDKEKLFNENIKIAYTIANTYKNYIYEREDIKQQALMGLWKAAVNYDERKGFKFSTFANVVIRNSINIYLRSVKKHCGNIFLYTTCAEGELSLEDMLADPKDCIEKMENIIDSNIILSKIKKDRDKFIIIETILKGTNHKIIAKKLNISKLTVATLKYKILRKLREEFLEDETKAKQLGT